MCQSNSALKKLYLKTAWNNSFHEKRSKTKTYKVLSKLYLVILNTKYTIVSQFVSGKKHTSVLNLLNLFMLFFYDNTGSFTAVCEQTTQFFSLIQGIESVRLSGPQAVTNWMPLYFFMVQTKKPKWLVFKWLDLSLLTNIIVKREGMSEEESLCCLWI